MRVGMNLPGPFFVVSDGRRRRHRPVRHGWRAHPVWTALLALAALGAVITYWYVVVPVLVVAVIAAVVMARRRPGRD